MPTDRDNVYYHILERWKSDPNALVCHDFNTNQDWRAEHFIKSTNFLSDYLLKFIGNKKRVIALSLHNSPETIICVMALWKLGHIVMPLPISLSQFEVQATLERAPVAGWIHTERYQHLGRENLKLPLNGLQLSLFAEKRKPNFPCAKTAFIRFTSGTTQEAKGVLISHSALMQRCRSFSIAVGLTSGQGAVWNLDMSYHFTTSITSFLLNGVCIFLGSLLIPSKFWQLCRREVDYVFALPSFYDNLLDSIKGCDSLEHVNFFSTGLALPVNLKQSLKERLHINIRNMYGVIEVGIPIISQLNGPMVALGHLVAPYQARLGEPKSDDSEVLFLQGPGMFDGYLMAPDFEFRPFVDDWFNTGDLVLQDAGGNFFLNGRKKEILNISGVKFFPSEVEERINAIQGVQASCVFIRADSNGQQELVAFIEADSALVDLNLKEILLAQLGRLKTPTAFRRVRPIPRTESGKVLRDFARLCLQWDKFPTDDV